MLVQVMVTLRVCLLIASTLMVPTLLAAADTPAHTTLTVRGGTLDVTLPDQPSQPSAADLLAWVKDAANAVTAYYGHFPVPHATLKIQSDDRHGVHHGTTWGMHGGFIRITVGRNTDPAKLKEDWMLTHEMIHLAFPSVADRHHWIEEGLSVYVEPVARAQAGNISVDEVWSQFVRDMLQGEPAAGDQGLDHTDTWGRTYWGGAMFALIADVQIRERTHNRLGLQDALRAILDHGGNITQDWDLDKAFAIGDQATGTGALQSLYREMRDRPVAVDLDALWKNLGIAQKAGHMVYDDRAPGAALRKAITARR